MTESIRYHDHFESELLKNTRTISVYVPPGYNRETSRRYPVFYLHDGQNLFDPATAFGGVPWGADETAERLISEGRIAPMILVGISNTKARLREYGPTGRWSHGRNRSFRYGRFVVEEVKPFIDRLYRTVPGRMHTAVGGSSMGGLISLFLSHWHPGVFGMCMAMSPSLWWDRELVLRKWPEDDTWLHGLRVWLDMGSNEAGTAAANREHLRRTRRLAQLMKRAGLSDGCGLRYHEVKGGSHHEHDWGRRFEDVLDFFFGGPACFEG